MKERVLAWSLIIVATLAVGILSAGCTFRSIKTERIENITRIMMNDPGSHYTFLIENPGSDQVLEREVRVRWAGSTPSVVWKKDVPTGQKMWAELTDWTDGVDTYHTVEIHIHNISDIEGGGWNHGKFGRGITSVVQ